MNDRELLEEAYTRLMVSEGNARYIDNNVKLAEQIRAHLDAERAAQRMARFSEHGHDEHADSVEIDTNDGRFVIRIVGLDTGTHVFDIHGLAFEFAKSKGLRDLLDWAAEGEAVRVERQYVIDGRERDDGYTVDDPKHSDYHDVMSELEDR